jgi:hypothetical protein
VRAPRSGSGNREIRGPRTLSKPLRFEQPVRSCPQRTTAQVKELDYNLVVPLRSVQLHSLTCGVLRRGGVPTSRSTRSTMNARDGELWETACSSASQLEVVAERRPPDSLPQPEPIAAGAAEVDAGEHTRIQRADQAHATG